MRVSKLIPLIPALLLCAAPSLAAAAVAIGISVNIAPPELPVYVQPPLPEPGYLWTPGYWAWDGTDYYWVPGTWVQPPSAELLWTPGYWGWNDGLYVWNGGYWGPTVGFYGGVNYGYGYTGVGFQGGYWHGGAFFYNHAVANFGHVNIVNVYTTPVTVRVTTRVSFNGGQGGVQARPTAEERVAMTQRHVGPTPLQSQHEVGARAMPAMHSTQNGGHPQILTTRRPGDFAHAGAGLQNHQRPAPQTHGFAPQVQDHQQAAREAHGAGAQLQEGGAARGQPEENGAPHGQPGEGPRPQGQPHEQKPRPQAQHPEKKEPERREP
jgi:WXXGXW repeat (2 copies)